MALGRNVALLAFASFLADVSGEMLMAVFPFLLVAQGATGLGLGLAGGAADAVGHLVKPFAGAVADRTRRRKPLIVAGYLAAALARVGIALASFWAFSALFRAADRVGKGLRTAPRDALLAESAPAAQRGRAFGLHRAADTAGAVVGVLAALAGLAWLGASPQAIVLAGAAFGILTLVPLLLVREADAVPGEATRVAEPASPRYRLFLLVAGVFALGQVSYVFYLVRAADAAGGETAAVALYLLFNVAYLLVAYPAGARGDAVGRPRVLVAGYVLFAASAAALLLWPTLPGAVAAFALLGAGFGMVDGVQRAYAADLAGGAARSTRLGVYHATTGLCTVAGGLAAGLLWDRVSPEATFAWGAVVPLAALGLLVGLGFTRAAYAPRS
ncbi:MAG TPA: MFS transporter [Candidatus Thermoplasmatota archaeon]|nr:MFS transporter [Candidatus Thermoplasmatota archaeon]